MKLESFYEDIFSRQSAVLAGMHLQWFAAEDEGRTEQPTEHKLREARKEGNVPKSQEVPGAVVLLFVIVTIALLAPYYVRTFRGMMIFFLGRSGEFRGILEGSLFLAFLSYFIRLVLPVFIASFVAAILGNVIQFGFLFSVKPITPDLNRIMPNFSRFVKQTLLSVGAVFNLVKSIFKVGVIGCVAFINIRSEFGALMNMIRLPFLQAAGGVAELAFRITLESALILLVMAIIDFRFRKHEYIEELKMSPTEVMTEHKSFEGDPRVRSRLRQLMRDLLTQNVGASVPKADVVITNPTHFAVALEYHMETMKGPVVTAKGQDNLAQTIKRIARENSIPVMENKPLAQALYRDAEIGDVIPQKYYDAVAAILTQVYMMGAKNRKAG
jgi:flagellar biosynthetic protein FlhB